MNARRREVARPCERNDECGGLDDQDVDSIGVCHSRDVEGRSALLERRVRRLDVTRTGVEQREQTGESGRCGFSGGRADGRQRAVSLDDRVGVRTQGQSARADGRRALDVGEDAVLDDPHLVLRRSSEVDECAVGPAGDRGVRDDLDLVDDAARTLQPVPAHGVVVLHEDEDVEVAAEGETSFRKRILAFAWRDAEDAVRDRRIAVALAADDLYRLRGDSRRVDPARSLAAALCAGRRDDAGRVRDERDSGTSSVVGVGRHANLEGSDLLACCSCRERDLVAGRVRVGTVRTVRVIRAEERGVESVAVRDVRVKFALVVRGDDGRRGRGLFPGDGAEFVHDALRVDERGGHRQLLRRCVLSDVSLRLDLVSRHDVSLVAVVAGVSGMG